MIKKIIKFFKQSKIHFWLFFSNFLTLLRIFLIPFIVMGIFNSRWLFVLVIFVIAGISDFFDGFIARHFNATSKFGATLDPLADKLLLISTFLAIAISRSSSFQIPYWFLAFIILREVVILFGALGVLFYTGQLTIAPTMWGKLNTFFYLLFIVWLVVCLFMGWMPVKSLSFTLILVAMFGMFSLIDYIKVGLRQIGKL